MSNQPKEIMDVVRFDSGPIFQGQMRVAKPKSACNLLLVLEVWDVKPTYRKSWTNNLLIWSDLTLGSLLQGQMSVTKLKSAYNLLVIAP